MKKLFLFIQLFVFFLGYSVPSNWNFDTKGKESMTLIFNSKRIGIENNNIDPTDLNSDNYRIGAFLTTNDTEICIGNTKYTTNDVTLEIWGIAKEDLNKPISLKLLDTNDNCELSNITKIEVNNNESLIYQPNKQIRVNLVIFSKNIFIAYQKDYCANVIINPNVEEKIKKLQFTSSNPLITVNDKNGIIKNTNINTINSTIITVESLSPTESCLQKTSYPITIYPNLKNSSSNIISCANKNITLNSTEISKDFTYKWLHNSSNSPTVQVINEGIYIVEKSYHSCIGYDTFSVITQNINPESISLKNETCLEKGLLTVQTEKIIKNNTNPLIFQLNKEIFSNGIFDSLSEGFYSLDITTSENCSFTYPFKIENECKSTNENILIPHIKEYSTFPIHNIGKIEIFNRNGELMKKLHGPTTWNGTNEKGEFVPIGVYFIVSNGQRINLTILD